MVIRELARVGRHVTDYIIVRYLTVGKSALNLASYAGTGIRGYIELYASHAAFSLSDNYTVHTIDFA